MTDAVLDFDRLLQHLRKIALFGSCGSVLAWDEQTYLPPAGGEHRANQLSLLAGMQHQMATSPELGDLIAEFETSSWGNAPDTPQSAVIREARRDYDRATKLPQRLVEEISKATSLGQQNWVEARKQKNFKLFLPWLEKIVALKREEAQTLRNEDDDLYDALLDAYEPGAKTKQVAEVFDKLRPPLVELLQKIQDSKQAIDQSILERHYPVDQQREFGILAANAIGFDFNAGRLDVAAHPFCSGFGPGDVRLTTRYDEKHFPGAFFGTLHEAGHGIYEQGLDPEWYGTAVGDSASLGIHESQSRMWENFVGRSRPFWTHFYPRAQVFFPAALQGVSVEAFYRAINTVRPTFIRVEADEVTYNLHIMLRFALEQQLIDGSLEPADVPQAWNDRCTSDLGITPTDDSHGCLQDVHWSAGLFGYFPTYALGNMYAAQLFNKAGEKLGDLDRMFAKGDFKPLKQWLNENVHHCGRQFSPTDLIERITGESLSPEPLVAHLTKKYSEVYQF